MIERRRLGRRRPPRRPGGCHAETVTAPVQRAGGRARQPVRVLAGAPGPRMAMPPVAYDGMPVAADAVTITRAVERPAIRNWFGKTARCTRSSVTAVSRRTAGVLRVFATSRSTWAVQVLAGRCAGNASVAVEGRIPARPAAERFGLPVPSARRPPAPRAVVK